MRLIQVLVPDDQLDAVTDLLEKEEVDFVRQRAWTDGEEQWLVEVPVPSDAIGYLLDRLGDAGVDEERYTIVTSAESAMTPRSEYFQERFADDFDPLTRPELRSKARDLSHDTRSFLAMIFLSAVIAVAGLLVGSPAVVVGSMVIAPIVGPVITASVGAVTGDREMLIHSVWLQAGGLAVAIAGATAFGFALQLAGFFPATLDISSIDLIGLRVAPTFATLAIGLAAGAASAYGLVTKGPTSLIGVMIAAALIPAAATTGIATVYGQYRIAVGSLLLLLLTMVLINVGAFVVLWRLEYRPATAGWLLSSAPSDRRRAVVATGIAVLAVVALVGVASFQQIAFEQTVNERIHEVLDEPRYVDLELVSARIEYSDGPFGSPETITVTVSRTADGTDPPSLAGEIDRRITEATGREVAVRVRFIEYQHSDEGEPSRSVTALRSGSSPADVGTRRGLARYRPDGFGA